MGKYEKLISLILGGESDANIPFDKLCHLMIKFGFNERVRGSHHIFQRGDIPDLVNLQQDGTKAKTYQVAMVRKAIL
ncbi:MAG: type II toxin-antitoxin system HicA family toxin [Calditrichaeota bacterium]|nr:type II toxin-antitoxin system HicA family toxin [Calditrichota bacterium]MBT7787466.1 type II toxin-antitoxin system HicA family toxin [Calditrichota bacterium]